MYQKNKQLGFTLIELVVVIVILGVLAATAAPRFINLSGDARNSVMRALEGSIRSAAALAHAKALAGNVVNGTINSNGRHYNIENRYPTVLPAAGGDNSADSAANAGNLLTLLELDVNNAISISITPNLLILTYDGVQTPATCRIIYANAPSNGEPRIILPDLGNGERGFNCN